MGGIVSDLYDVIAYRVFRGISLHALSPLFYKEGRRPKRPGFLLALFGNQYCWYRRQLRTLISTNRWRVGRVDRPAPGSAKFPWASLERLIR